MSLDPAVILMVDDRQENLVALEAVLRSPSYCLIGKNSGEDALRYVMEADLRNLALILMDVQMPGMDGYETVSIMRQRKELRTVPVIFITAIHKSKSNVLKGYVNGSVDYIFKPYDPDVLRWKVKNLVSMHQYKQELERKNEQLKSKYEELKMTNRKLVMDQMAMEKRLSQSDRLYLIGEMAAGVAHEIRNPMTTIQGFLQMWKKSEKPLPKEHIDLMLSELFRANTIISEYLSLAGNKESRFKVLDVGDLLASLSPLLEAVATMEEKQLTVRHQADHVRVYADEKELRQVIINLAKNGLEAMKAGGVLEIRTRVESGYVVIDVIDQGTGIPEELLSKIGTPFFTTKESGTGLGLALCYSIVQRHNGELRLNTSPQGTTFSVWLPKM